jgi:type IV secretory pathway VirB10-like protein
MFPPASGAPTVQNRAPSPPGVLPRHVQTWVVLGIALLMTGIIAMSGPSRPSDKRAPAKTPSAMEANQARIQEYRKQIDEEAQRLAAAKADLEALKSGLNAPAPGTSHPAENTSPAAAARQSDETVPADASLEHEKAQREYRALFADNLALTLRKQSAPGDAVTAGAQHATGARHDAPSGQREAPGNRHEAAGAPSELPGTRKYVVREGTIIEAVLTNRLDGSFTGPVNGMVTTAVYSKDRQTVLIPQGARILGEAKAVASLGQQRLSVAFHRLIMPDGTAIMLDHAKAPEGLSQAGETALHDKVDHHYAALFGASFAIGVIGGLAQADARIGLNATGGGVYRESLASSAAQSSLHILDRFLNRLPTVTIREGQRLKVYLTADLEIERYADR